MKSYVTLLSTDSYLDGVLALVSSLRKTKTTYPILCLVTPNVSPESIQRMKEANIAVQETQLIPHPSGSNTYKKLNYTKINIFGLEAYDRLVYLDSDTVVLQNIDDLFSMPHMTACRAGTRDNWKHFNSGVMVIEPSILQFRDMRSKMNLFKGSSDSGEQAFLHDYFPEWVTRPELQLPSAYNTLVGDASADLSGVKVLHYVGEHKPWTHFDPRNPMHVVWKSFSEPRESRESREKND